MDVIYLLIPVSLALVAAIAAAFVWASRNGQFDDVERHGRDILLEAERAPVLNGDACQPAPGLADDPGRAGDRPGPR